MRLHSQMHPLLINHQQIINRINSFQVLEDTVQDHSTVHIIVLSTEEIIEVIIHINSRIDHRISKRLDNVNSHYCSLLVWLVVLSVSHRINLPYHHHLLQKMLLRPHRLVIRDHMILHFIHRIKLISMLHHRHHLIKQTTRIIVVVTRTAFAVVVVVVDTTDFPNEVDPIIIETVFSDDENEVIQNHLEDISEQKK